MLNFHDHSDLALTSSFRSVTHASFSNIIMVGTIADRGGGRLHRVEFKSTGQAGEKCGENGWSSGHFLLNCIDVAKFYG